MKKILIIGAGGFGRELYYWLLQHPGAGTSWQVAGFLDDNSDALAGFDLPIKVVASASGYEPKPDDLLVCALGLPKIKQRVCLDLKARGARFMTFVHPSVVLGGQVTLGEGVVLCPGVILTSCIKLGDFAMFNCQASAGHDVEVGSCTTISGHCDLTGRCKVGANVFMGSRVSLIPGITVGDNAVVGAGAVVIRAVKAGTTVFGNPAREVPI